MSTEFFSQLPISFWPLAIAALLVLSILFRLQTDKPLFARRLEAAKFSEVWASARVGTGPLARRGTAKNCIHIQITDKSLEVHPHFPFTLGFMPEIYNLDHRIPLSEITSVSILGAGRLSTVEVKYAIRSGETGVAQFLVKDAASFIRHCTSGCSAA